MLAGNIIAYTIPPLKPSDTAEKALTWMSEFCVRHLPIVDNGELIGVVAEEDMLNILEPQKPLSEVASGVKKHFVYVHQHLYDVMKGIVDLNISVVPVLNEENKYLGLITLESLIRKFAESGSLSHPGGVIVLEMDYRDYSLSEIARILESEKAVILSSFISSPHGTTKLELTIKINKQELQNIVATLERFEYNVKASFQESDYLDTLQERYDHLMAYLNV